MESTVRNLMFDLALGRDIYDNDKKIGKAEANDTLRRACFELLGLSEHSTEKQIKRALKSERATEFFEVIEELIEQEVEYGFKDNEFFNDFVETRNLADGDRADFWTDDDIILNVAKVSGDHHDLNYCRVCIA